MKQISNKKIILISITIFISVLVFSYLLSFFHEIGHQQELIKHNIASKITMKYPKFQSMFSLATTRFSKEDCIKINSLNSQDKTNIMLAGVKTDIIVISILIFSGILSLLLSFFFYLKKNPSKYYLFFFIGIFLLLLAFSRVINLSSNLSYKQGTDAFFIINNLTC